MFDTLNEVKDEIKYVSSTSITDHQHYFTATLWNNVTSTSWTRRPKITAAQEAIEADIF